ncbi:MAG: RidA family protein [Bacteroidetes bacterium]|nr:RidA family protein [Bacteroidota bacterium]
MKKYFLVAFLLFAISIVKSQTPDQNLQALGIVLPKPVSPLYNYVKFVRTGNLIYLSGQGPAKPDGTFITGKLGRELTVEEGASAAKLTGINLIATLKDAIGDLSKVKRIVKVFGMVNCTENFYEQPKVINGFSDLMVAVFGEKGRHARSAVGMYSLPMNISVEIEMIVEVEDK